MLSNILLHDFCQMVFASLETPEVSILALQLRHMMIQGRSVASERGRFCTIPEAVQHLFVRQNKATQLIYNLSLTRCQVLSSLRLLYYRSKCNVLCTMKRVKLKSCLCEISTRHNKFQILWNKFCKTTHVHL